MFSRRKKAIDEMLLSESRELRAQLVATAQELNKFSARLLKKVEELREAERGNDDK